MQDAYKTGFWLSANPESAMKGVSLRELRGYSLLTSDKSAWDFLHGNCLAFAAVLNKTFGYEIRIAWDASFEGRTENIWETPAICSPDGPESFWEHLVHGYCAAELDGRTVYIDVRGITTERQPFFDAFAKRFHPHPFEEREIPPALLEKFLLSDEDSRPLFSLAKTLIDAKKNDYTLFRGGGTPPSPSNR